MKVSKNAKLAAGVVAVIGAAVAAFHFYGHQTGAKARYGAAGSRIQRSPHVGDELYRARLARKGGGRGPIQDSGITNVGQYDSGGAGWRGWESSAWSPLTQRNENKTYSHTRTNKLLRTPAPGLKHFKLQGATGLTHYPWGTIYTYW